MRSAVVPSQNYRIKLSKGLDGEKSKFEYDEEGSDDDIPEDDLVQNRIGLEWEFWNETWLNPNIVYDPMPNEFSRHPKGPHFPYNTIPYFMFLFELFWTTTILNGIVEETNEYVRGAGIALESTMGGSN